MTNQPNIRLNKVLRELNISLDRVVEFLNQKGFEVEPRPTAKITEEVYQVLLSEFATDKSKKDASQEVSEEKRKEKESLRIIQEKKELERIEKAAQAEVIKTARVSLEKPKTLGKIDLEKGTKKPQEAQNQQPKKEEKVVENKAPKTVTPPPTPKPAEESAAPEAIQTKYQKLSGPKQTGQTVNLDAVKEKEKTVEDARRRKRKRISKEAPPKPKAKETTKSRPKQQQVREENQDEDVQKQIRETLEKLQGKASKSKAAKYRRDKRVQHRQKSEEELAQQEAESKLLRVTEFITVGEVATMMEVTTSEIISACMSLGIMVTMNQRLDAETLSIVADEFGFDVSFEKAEIEENIENEEDHPDDLEARAPIVTVMGHVDHGKTSLLDYIREENVIAGESGGITQHIDAYAVTLPKGQKITFLDTPGHEAFTAMRARGAQVTDIAIIVVAADDNIMPQTKEAISHAQAANVPIIFAINKIDKPTADPEKVKESLAGMNLMVEDWGGKIQSHDISALKGTGVQELLEKVLLEAELLELKANPNRNAKGTVVEAFLDKGRGYVSTVIVQNGTLKMGDYLLAGKQSGKVKAMFDERGNKLKQAPPAKPVSLLGLDGAPQAGDGFVVLEDEREAKEIAAKRTQLLREQNVRTQRHITLDEIGRRIALGDFKELNIILKGDVDGSVEALTDSLQ